MHQQQIRNAKNAKGKHDMVWPTLKQIRFNKRCEDIPSFGNKIFSKMLQTSQNFQTQYS